MPGNDEDAPDDTSIQPVSSLRSRFEALQSTDSLPATAKSSNFPLRGAAPERERASLDIPRTALPWKSQSNTSSREQSPHKGERTNHARPLEPLSSRQRPVSMAPWSPPRTPPQTDEKVPRSPPKFSLTSETPPGAGRVDPPTLSLSVLESKPRFPPSTTSPIPTSSGVPSNQRPLVRNIAGRRSPAPPVPRPKSPVPPPVNRAAKPLAPKPRTQRGSSLEAGSTIKDERISPFSTPPSSDGNSSPEKDEARLNGLKSTALSVDEFLPPPTHHSVLAKKQISQDMTIRKAQRKDSYPRSQPPTRPDQLDLPNARPTLPSRPQAGESPKARASTLSRAETMPLPSSQPTRRIVSAQAQAPPRPSNESKAPKSVQEFLPPPKRVNTSELSKMAPSRTLTDTPPPLLPPQTLKIPSRSGSPQGHMIVRPESTEPLDTTSSPEYPDATHCNRRHPRAKSGAHYLDTKYETKLFDLCGQYACAASYSLRAWNLKRGHIIYDEPAGEREVKIMSIAFRPTAKAEDQGTVLWAGNNYGDIDEIDIRTGVVLDRKTAAHQRREVVKMHRYQNNMWSLGDDGSLLVWLPSDKGIPSLRIQPLSYRCARGYSFSLAVKGYLWLATGKDLRVYQPGAKNEQSFYCTVQPLSQPGLGEITSGAMLSDQQDKVYVAHSDGKISIYSTQSYSCLGVIAVSGYKISALAGAGRYLWAGYGTGMMCVYDTSETPWVVKKEWLAHDRPVANLVVDRSSAWKSGELQVGSIGLDSTIRIWDGMLEDDWLEADMEQRDAEYCSFREITAVIATWNAGASAPGALRYDERNTNFFREVIQSKTPPDILVFGFQELIDLEDKKLTAKSFFKGNKRKDPAEHEQMSHQYRAWRDFLQEVVEDNMPVTEPYELLHAANMVGLFSCVFIKASLRPGVGPVHVAEVKRGLGGLHGNKGALILRFLLHDSSICLVNCHLAAGQSQTLNRNNDIAVILESSVLPQERDMEVRKTSYIGGGDGSMILDHEICILNGDLNYRIDTISRDAVVRIINSGKLERLLERDQLLVSLRRNPAFRLRSFNEQAISFAPTYKYDVGTDNYDSSEKNRSPAWCDRLLYRGKGRIKQTSYRRHELWLSDHRPVSGTFKIRVKSVVPEKRERVWKQCQDRLISVRKELAQEASVDYLINVLGIEEREAHGLVDT